MTAGSDSRGPLTIGVLGAGQLGRMLALAGIPLGFRFVFLDPGTDAPAGRIAPQITADYDDLQALDDLAAAADIVTFEFENVPAAAVERLEKKIPVWPPIASLRSSQDRLAERELLQACEIPVARFATVENASDLRAAAAAIGTPLVLKTRRDGYDGKGQIVVNDTSEAEAAFAAIGSSSAIAEEQIVFDRELSLVAVRALDGETRFYPLVENQHQDGILRRTDAPANQVSAKQQSDAERYATALFDKLEYVGVMTIELFEAGDTLIANELAPRVHNSGHWTIEAAATSQFENHLRAIAGLPLGATHPLNSAVMLNLIGAVPSTHALLSVAGTHLHLYDKAPRPGRKLGHVTAVGDPEQTVAAAATVERMLQSDGSTELLNRA